MTAKRNDEFKRDAVRIAHTSGLTQRQVKFDLCIGLSTIGQWVYAISEEARVPRQDAEFLRENKRGRKIDLRPHFPARGADDAAPFVFHQGPRPASNHAHIADVLGASHIADLS
jgi:transposase